MSKEYGSGKSRLDGKCKRMVGLKPLRNQEIERLLGSGYCEIDDPERGHVIFRLERTTGPKDTLLTVEVKRGGNAVEEAEL